MTPDLFPILPEVLAGAGALVSGILSVRVADQRRRDKAREVISIRFPRNLTDKQVQAVVRAMLGLAPATSGLSGRDSVVLEVIGTV
jgi:hypothetical protein